MSITIRRGTIRAGAWLFAYHGPRYMRWRRVPGLCRWPGRGWALAWGWFEIARVR